MDRYEVMAGKMAPLTDGAHRKWGFAGKVETRSYERLVDARSMIGDTTRRIASRPRPPVFIRTVATRIRF